MTRSKWKGNFISSSLLNKKLYLNQTDDLKIWSRNSVIPEILKNKMVSIYNGKEFIKVFIDEKKIGFKFGEFALTKKHTKKKTKSQKKKERNNNYL